MEQVLTNLLDNAVKYSPDGGVVEVDVQMVTSDTLHIAVRDQGLGISPEYRPYIFDRFFQAHAKGYYGGMGLGLYISRQIVELHGGRLQVCFPSNIGTEFVITLPINTPIVHQGATYEPNSTHSVC
jgi:signal transduction histidine kinase